MNVLVVVDMQNDFVDGALGTKEAAKIVPAVVDKIKEFQGHIIYTRDTHEENYLDTQEGKCLPVAHCIRGTKGWELCPQIKELCQNTPLDKPSFGSTELGMMLKAAEGNGEKVDTVTFAGLCTDICIISNAMIVKAFLPEAEVIVDASCCAGVTPESHRQALEAMKVCQIKVENE